MKEKFYDKLNALYALYDNVTSARFLLEQFDKESEFFVAPLNELRCALDHVFRAMKPEIDVEYELGLVKEHIERAGYDALALLASTLGTRIAKNLEPYETDTFTNIFPEYFSEIKPKITGIQKNIAEWRNGRGGEIENSFMSYFNEIKELIDIDKKVDMRIPALQEFSDKKKKEKQDQQRTERIWQYFIAPITGPIIGFVSASIIAFLIWFFKIKTS